MSGRHTGIKWSGVFAFGLLVLALTALPRSALAVPSYARQTGLACEACHTVFPQLTPFGRAFKASGYTLFNTLKVAGHQQDKAEHAVAERSSPSLGDGHGFDQLRRQGKRCRHRARLPPIFRSSLSLFYAGRIADNVGAYMQLTYDDQSGTIGIDNTDIRFADVATFDGHSVIYGVSLNNNPTVQDLWNSTPAWGQPFIGSPALQGPAAATQIEGAMAQFVAGLSAYVLHRPVALCRSRASTARRFRAPRWPTTATSTTTSSPASHPIGGSPTNTTGARIPGNSGRSVFTRLAESHDARRQCDQCIAAECADRPLPRCRPRHPISIHRRRRPDYGRRALDAREPAS